MSVHFEPVKQYIGARVYADKREDFFTPEAAKAINEAVDKYVVLVFPRLNLTDEEQLRITDNLGGRLNLTSNATTDKSEDVYKVTLDKKVNKSPEYVLGTFFWHMDGLPVETPPPRLTLLSARKLAPQGGQTEFCNTYAAYELLPEAEKKELEGLKAEHSVAASLRLIVDQIPADEVDAKTKIGIIKQHPIAWSRRDGRKSLIIGWTADYIVGMPVAAGRSILTRLMEWAAQPALSYRHFWEEGDFVIWDNCGAMHRVVPYAVDSGRMMHRTSIAGTETTI